jgi:hypothetical protein
MRQHLLQARSAVIHQGLNEPRVLLDPKVDDALLGAQQLPEPMKRVAPVTKTRMSLLLNFPNVVGGSGKP